MKRNLLFVICLAVAALLPARADVSLEVSNSLPRARAEVVEVDCQSVGIDPAGPLAVVVVDANGREVPAQLTHDGKLAFVAEVPAKGKAKYALRPGHGQYPTRAAGAVYPYRDDDLAWENENVAFRAYGPALQRRGERGYGYDLFLKRDTLDPILPQMYADFLNPENWRAVNELKAQGKHAEAREFENSFTYHVDHGHGMDCYAVGPTLGAGVAALIGDDGKLAFPWCYETVEILDRGPVRFAARLRFTPLVVGKDTLVEERLIVLDSGSNLNRTEVTYSGLTVPRQIAQGIVLRDGGAISARPGNGYISYVDPTQGPDNGKVFVGAVYPAGIKETRVVYKDGSTQPAYPGHVLGVSDLQPGQTFVYYWGFGWDRGNMPSIEDWNEYLAQQVEAQANPLKIKIKN